MTSIPPTESPRSYYLYLQGITVAEPIQLTHEASLLPGSFAGDFNPLDDLARSADKDSYAIALMSLPRVSSQLKVIVAPGPDGVASLWNAVWYAVVLGGVLGVDINCNLQADVAISELVLSTGLVVTNLAGHGRRAGAVSIEEDDRAWLEGYFESAWKLQHRTEVFRNALHALWSYRWHGYAHVQMAVLWSGIEGLIGIDSELRFRLSLSVAHFLAGDDRDERLRLFASTKKLYDKRSKAVHGGDLGEETARRGAVSASAALLKRLIRRSVELDRIPSEVNDLGL